MNMSINKIQKIIYGDCLEVEKKVVQGKHNNSEYWSFSNSIRDAYTIEEIENYIKQFRTNEFNVLNASGIAAGQVDFPILNYLRKNYDLQINWEVIDSPNNPYLSNEFFKYKIEKLNINLKLLDFSLKKEIDKEFNKKFDLILFTEIVEHLDYSVLLDILSQLARLLSDNGIIILTTPNLLSLGFRIKMLLGSTNGMFWGDGYENKQKGLFGHITYYSIDRLKRILSDANFEVIKSFTFDYGYRNSILSKIKGYIKRPVINLIDNTMYNHIFIVAKHNNNCKKITYQI